jgi:TolB-like protein
MSFIGELKRRNVVRVGIAYVLISWLLAQVAEFAFENFGAPEWVLKTFVVVLLLGMPLALFFAWAFELTPEGLKREVEVDRTSSITPQTGRKLDRLIIVGLVIAVVYFAWNSQREPVPAEAPTAETSVVTDMGPDVRSIAVLPFVNMSSDEEQEWFADGLTEELLNSLARMPDLLVAARTSSFGYKGSTDSIPNIAKALGVAHVLEGSVRRGNDRLRITAQLIRAADGFHLWSETYDRSPDDVIAIQEDLAIEIARALETAMDPEALEEMVSAGTASVPAYEAYLKGLALITRANTTGDANAGNESLEKFEEATRIDPKFSSAYAQQSIFWRTELGVNNIGTGDTGLQFSEIMSRYKQAISQAIANERDLVRVALYKADEAIVDLRIRDADALLNDYLVERPNDADVLETYLTVLLMQGRWEDARPIARKVANIRGDDTQSIQWLIAVLVFAGDYQAASDVAGEALRRFPDNAFVQYQAHRALLWNGEYDAASRLLPLLEKQELPPYNYNLASLRQVCAMGDELAARRTLRKMELEFSDSDLIWIPYYLFGMTEKVVEQFMPIYEAGQLTTLAALLQYPYFDPRPYPDLMKILQEQGIQRAAPIEIPFACRY